MNKGTKFFYNQPWRYQMPKKKICLSGFNFDFWFN